MHLDHLGLTVGSGRFARWAAVWAVIPVWLCSLPVRTGPVPGQFVGSSTRPTGTWDGAVFVPAVAPVISKTKNARDVFLSWTAVSVRPGTVIAYSVVRYRNGANPTAVCTGASAPVLSTGTVTCTDQGVPNGSLTYSEQPSVITDGSVTWSLPPSVPA